MPHLTRVPYEFLPELGAIQIAVRDQEEHTAQVMAVEQAARLAVLRAEQKQRNALLGQWDPMLVIASPFPSRPAPERNKPAELAKREDDDLRKRFPHRYE